MAYEERPGPARRDNQMMTWIIVAVVVIVVALLAWFLFLRPEQEVVAPGNGVDVVDPADEGVVDEDVPVTDEDTPVTDEDGAYIVPFPGEGSETEALAA